MLRLLTVLFFSTALSFAATTQWDVEGSHSVAKFKVRHMGISNVYGQITGMKGSFTADEKDVTKLAIQTSLDANTINTNNEKRDGHLKSGDFFNTEKFPTIDFKSKKISKKGDKLEIVGDLSMHGVTKEVKLENAELTNPIKDPSGNQRRGFSALLNINRKDFGITWNKVIDNGGLAVSDTVEINVEAEMLAKK